MTARSRIGGVLDYARLAQLNRPRTHDEMRDAVHELAASGMGADSIARACGLSVEAVRALLAEPPAVGAP